MKKVKIFGKTIPIWLMALLIASPVMAVLVNYLSNTVTYTATIESPLNIHDLTPANGDFGTVYGGDTITATYQIDNRANNDVDGKHVITIYAQNSDLQSGDITEVTFTYDSGTTYTLSGTDITETPGDFNADGKQDLRYTTPAITHPASSSGVSTVWEITFNPAIQPDNYTIDVVVTPA